MSRRVVPVRGKQKIKKATEMDPKGWKNWPKVTQDGPAFRAPRKTKDLPYKSSKEGAKAQTLPRFKKRTRTTGI